MDLMIFQYADNTDFTVGFAPFTCWVYKTASGEDFFGVHLTVVVKYLRFLCCSNRRRFPSNSLRALLVMDHHSYDGNSGIDFVLNKWVHIAFVRDGNTLRLFKTGSGRHHII